MQRVAISRCCFVTFCKQRQRNEQRTDQFRYIKIQPKTKDLSKRLWGINTEFVGFYSPESRAKVYCFRLEWILTYRNCSIIKHAYTTIVLVPVSVDFCLIKLPKTQFKRQNNEHPNEHKTNESAAEQKGSWELLAWKETKTCKMTYPPFRLR